jgi:hypothetical protein
MDFSDLPSLRLLLLVLVTVVSFSSCGKKNQTRSFLSFDFNDAGCCSTEEACLKQAKYVDIPVPISFTPLEIQNRKDLHNLKYSELLCFGGDLSLKQVIDFYQKSFERDGWEIQNLSNEYEGLLWCTNVNRSCSVSIRSENLLKKKVFYKTYVYVFIKKTDVVVDDFSEKNINSKRTIL